MRQFRSIVPLLLTALGGCQPPLDSEARHAAETRQTDAPPSDSRPDPSGLGQQDVAPFALPASYASARAALLAGGWLPLRDAGCWANVGGRAEVCNVLPETEACSSDGRCVMHFGHVEQATVLRVTTYGDWSRWSLEGRDGLQVASSQASSVEAAPALACPASTFDGFLAAFASSEATRIAFTAPLVRVAELNSTEDGDFSREVLMRGREYAGFNIRHEGDAFRFVDAEGRIDPSPLPLDIGRTSNTYTVRYQYGMSEGNDYVFVAHAGCWRLVADPEPPTP